MLSAVQQSRFERQIKSGREESRSNLAAQYFNLKWQLTFFFKNLSADKQAAFENYLKTAQAFLEIGLTKKWGYYLLISQEKEDFLLQQKEVSEFEDLYLTLDHLINISYFDRRQAAYVHAWHIFLKFGLGDLNFSAKEIEEKLITNCQLKD